MKKRVAEVVLTWSYISLQHLMLCQMALCRLPTWNSSSLCSLVQTGYLSIKLNNLQNLFGLLYCWLFKMDDWMNVQWKIIYNHWSAYNSWSYTRPILGSLSSSQARDIWIICNNYKKIKIKAFYIHIKLLFTIYYYRFSVRWNYKL